MTTPGLLLLLALAATPSSHAVEAAQISVSDPPAYGYQVGDVAERRVRIQLPAGAKLDLESLPTPNRQGGAVELSSLVHQGASDAAEQSLLLRYQVLRSPEVPTVFELPTLNLRTTVPTGQAGGKGLREALLRVPAHPLMVSPIAPAQPPNRAGLGPLQPDLPAPLPPMAPIRQRAKAWGVLALVALGWLLWRHVLRALLWRRQRPLARAWRDIRRLPAAPDEHTLGAALRRLHSALNEDAGRVLLAADVPAWLAQRPQYQAQAAALQDLHQRSSQHFFAAPGHAPPDLAADTQRLRNLARALAQSEARA